MDVLARLKPVLHVAAAGAGGGRLGPVLAASAAPARDEVLVEVAAWVCGGGNDMWVGAPEHGLPQFARVGNGPPDHASYVVLEIRGQLLEAHKCGILCCRLC